MVDFVVIKVCAMLLPAICAEQATPAWSSATPLCNTQQAAKQGNNINQPMIFIMNCNYRQFYFKAL